MAVADIVPLNFPILMDPRNWVFVAFIIFIIGALVHYLVPLIASPTAATAS